MDLPQSLPPPPPQLSGIGTATIGAWGLLGQYGSPIDRAGYGNILIASVLSLCQIW